MWRVQRGDLARAAKIRDGRMHKGRKSVTRFPSWIKKGDDRPGSCRTLTADEVREREYLAWFEMKTPPKRELAYAGEGVKGLRGAETLPGLPNRCPRGWGGCSNACPFKGSASCPIGD